MFKRILPLVVLSFFAVPLQAAPERTPFETARALEAEGKDDAAFLRFAAIAGAESRAVEIARSQAGHFLDLLRADKDVPALSRRLVEGDLLLALRRRDEALADYRAAAQLLAETAQNDARDGWQPRRAYAVDVPPATGGGDDDQFSLPNEPLLPLSQGPGSHRDNWLVRRFIALEAWDDAAREMARVWEIHRQRTRPFVTEFSRWNPQTKTRKTQRSIVTPSGFDERGRQFVVDYAYFLKRRKESEAAFAVLHEALLRLDLEQGAAWGTSKPLGDDKKVTLLRRDEEGFRFSWQRPAMPSLEFLRLAYGEFQGAKRVDELKNAIQQQINAGDNRARRVLAAIFLHENQSDTALQLELDYVKNSDFSAFGKAFRSARVYDDFRKTREAVALYEAALQLSIPIKVNGQDAERPARLDEQYAPQIWGALERLYAALGQNERVLDVVLSALDFEKNFGEGAFTDAARRFQAAGQTARFETWARQRLSKQSDAPSRAELAWLLRDWPVAASAVAQAAQKPEFATDSLPRWKERFKKQGAAPWRLLLETLTKANPQDTISQLELLQLNGEQTSAATRAAQWEALLNGPPELLRERFGGPRAPQLFKSHYHLAYRLARYYASTGQEAKLQALARRVARREKPFDAYRDEDYTYSYSNDVPEHANALLAVAIERADATSQVALAQALEKSPWQGARAQLARRRSAPQAARATPSGTWANLPPGVRLLVSMENVLCLCRDATRLYVGHPWGVAIYDFKGNLLKRIALGEAPRDMIVLKGALWMAAPYGVERVDLKSYAVSHLNGDQDVDPGTVKGSPESRDFYNGAVSVAAQGDWLWIGTRRDVRRLNTRTNELRIFSQQELKVDSHGEWSRFLFDGPYVWADSYMGVRRFDARTEQWQALREPQLKQREPTHLIGVIDGQLWGTTYLTDELRHRPCRINRETLQVTPILLNDGPKRGGRSDRLINQPFDFIGRYAGQLVFAAESRKFFLDAKLDKLRPLGTYDTPFKGVISSEMPAEVRGVRDALRRTVKLPDGTWVFGRRTNMTRYEYPREDWPFYERPRDVPDGEGGLFLVAQGKTRRISGAPGSDALPGDVVLTALASGDRWWLGTEAGLVEGKAPGQVLGLYRRGDGLPCNRISAAAAVNGKLYLATRWEDSKGALLVYDPQTRVFVPWLSEDGLASDALETVAPDPARPDVLQLTYGVEYRRFDNGGYQLAPPGWFNAATSEFSAAAAPRILKENEAMQQRQRASLGALPLLGGRIISRQAVGGYTLLCGTRGVVVLKGGEAPTIKSAPLVVRLIFGADAVHLADAKKRSVKIASVGQLKTALIDKNPLYRANALASLLGQPKLLADPAVARLVQSQLDAPEVRLRSTALYIAVTHQSKQTPLTLLQKRLADAEPALRAAAAVGICRRGVLPEMKILRPLFEEREVGSVPFGAESSITLGGFGGALWNAVAPLATPEIFQLLLETPRYYPLSDDLWPQILQNLGASLRKRPENAPVLLRAYDADRHNPRQVNFASLVFKQAGKEMLPILREALKSPDRVVRSNAARACGAIGEASLVPDLIAALELESGLSRASIVWALGELKAQAALPRLAALYADARRDAARANGGFLAAQSNVQFDSQVQFLANNLKAAQNSQFQSLKKLDDLGGEWNELKASATPRPIDPKRNEELLTPEHVLKAVSKIGAAHAQEFYRALAGASDAQARGEAAAHLAEAPPAEVQKNLPLLRALLADGDEHVCRAAAVSLIIAGQSDGRALILRELREPRSGATLDLLNEMKRVEDGKQLAFAREALVQLSSNADADSYAEREIAQKARQLLKVSG